MKIYKDQRGIANIAIVLIVLVLAIAGAGYYFVTKANKDADNNASADSVGQQAAEAACSLAIEDKDLCKAASKIEASRNYTITMASSEAGGAATITIAYDGDNFHMKTTSAEGSAETISLGGAFYMRDSSSDTWIKYPAAATPDTPIKNEADTLDFSEENITGYTKVGKESCGSLTCFHYTYVDPSEPGVSFSLWFDDKDYLLRKLASTDGGEKMEMTYDYSKVTIQAPQNYQELPSAL